MENDLPDRGRVRYQNYINSKAWRRSDARKEELRRSGSKCRLCARGSPTTRIEVHHNSYERLGQEDVMDLCTLCSDCHKVVTSELRRREYAVRALPERMDTPRVLENRTLVDSVADRWRIADV